MRITDVEAIALFVPVEGLEVAPFHVRHADEVGPVLFRGYGTTLVRITTDEGLQGVGECGSRLAPMACKAIVDELRPLVIGADPSAPDKIWSTLYATLESAGHSTGYFIEAISGIDTAVWDLCAKAVDLPLHRLLGGARRTSVIAYASSLPLSAPVEVLMKRAERFAADGYSMVKAKIGQNPSRPEPELETLAELVRAATGRLRFVVDANGVYDYRTALRVGRALDDIGVDWFEEPLPPSARADQIELAKRLDTPLAGGESEYTRFHFRDLAVSRAYAILQPNVARAGGVSEVRKILALCDAFGLGYAPHIGTSSAICVAASLHLAAAAEGFIALEHMGPGWSEKHPNVLRHDLLRVPVEVVVGGMAQVPIGPGLGVTLDGDVVDRWRVA